MRALAFTGMPGSGKSVAVEVARDLGVPVVRMGDAVWSEVGSRGLPLTNENVGRVATEMRERHGRGIWAERTCDRILDLKTGVVVIDGVRSQEEVDVFRARLGEEFSVVAIHAAPGTRLMRLLERRRPDDVASAEEFHARDERELGWGIGRVIALADVVVVNEENVPSLKENVRGLLAE